MINPSKPTVYLAGPMVGLSFKDASQWRNTVTRKLKSKWNILSPLTALDQKSKFPFKTLSQTDTDHRPIKHVPSAFVTVDEFFVDKCDFVLANFIGSTRVSIGTVWELGYAWGQGKKIVSIIEPESIHDHPFLRRRSHLFVPTLAEAIEFLGSIVG